MRFVKINLYTIYFQYTSLYCSADDYKKQNKKIPRIIIKFPAIKITFINFVKIINKLVQAENAGS